MMHSKAIFLIGLSQWYGDQFYTSFVGLSYSAPLHIYEQTFFTVEFLTSPELCPLLLRRVHHKKRQVLPKHCGQRATRSHHCSDVYIDSADLQQQQLCDMELKSGDFPTVDLYVLVPRRIHPWSFLEPYWGDSIDRNLHRHVQLPNLEFVVHSGHLDSLVVGCIFSVQNAFFRKMRVDFQANLLVHCVLTVLESLRLSRTNFFESDCLRWMCHECWYQNATDPWYFWLIFVWQFSPEKHVSNSTFPTLNRHCRKISWLEQEVPLHPFQLYLY